MAKRRAPMDIEKDQCKKHGQTSTGSKLGPVRIGFAGGPEAAPGAIPKREKRGRRRAFRPRRDERQFEGSMTSATMTAAPTRRDFLFLTTGAVGAVGVAALAWPLIDQMNPDAATLALSSIEVDIGTNPGRPDRHGQVARRPGLHPSSHQEGNRGRGEDAPFRTPRSANRSVPCPEARMADRHRRLHPSRLRAART